MLLIISQKLLNCNLLVFKCSRSKLRRCRGISDYSLLVKYSSMIGSKLRGGGSRTWLRTFGRLCGVQLISRSAMSLILKTEICELPDTFLNLTLFF
jgi:hypothetical protein